MEWLALLLRNVALSGKFETRGAFSGTPTVSDVTTYQRFKAVLVAYHKSRTSLTLVKKGGAENR